jgi:phosphatidylethanolamine/phosphatidyl-N-methylethanolamine N-methyltransferase
LSAQKRQGSKTLRQPRIPLELHLGDEARFIRSWLENPKIAGAVAPSGRFLARALAQCVDPEGVGPIVELGPGTGPVTSALLARGIAPERLVLVEYEKGFCSLLAKKFPGVKILRGDAYNLTETLKGALDQSPSAIVSSLPLLTVPEHARLGLLRQAFELMGPEGRFVQFTYGVNSPLPKHMSASLRIRTQALAPIWLNLPPARIFIYRSAQGAAHVEAPSDVFDKILRGSRRAAREIRDEFVEARARLGANGHKRRR